VVKKKFKTAERAEKMPLPAGSKRKDRKAESLCDLCATSAPACRQAGTLRLKKFKIAQTQNQLSN
jgi:hypothetical protein